MRRLTLGLLTALALLGCRAEENMSASGNGSAATAAERLTTVYQLRDFTGFSASGALRVVFHQGDAYSVEVDESPNPYVQTTVELHGKMLHLGQKTLRRNVNLRSDESPVVRITAPRLADVSMSGATTLHIAGASGQQLRLELSGASKAELGTLKYEQARLNCEGASKVEANVVADDVDINASGASKLQLKVEGKRLEADCSGATKCDIIFQGDEVDFDCSGAGKVNLQVDCQRLTARNSGASKFCIGGTADHTKIDASGVAKIDTSMLNKY